MVESMVETKEQSADLLIEIGVEELPAGSARPMAQFLGDELLKALKDNQFAPAAIEIFSTPRRMAVRIESVLACQASKEVEKRGPALSAAFDDDGNPTKALSGFARSCGVEPDALTRVETDKGVWLVHRMSQAGQGVGDFLNAELPKLLKRMPMPKRMRWSDGSDEFLRPVVWLLALHGNDLLPLKLLGLSAARMTHGHRFHAPEPLAVESPAHYQSLLLEQGYVMASFDARRDRLVAQVQACAKEAGAVVVMDPVLVDEVTSLVEWPVAIHGKFEERFLELPKEALIQTMEENQRYFALLNAKGELEPGFVTVANLESKNVERVRTGNERVIRPRFDDTMFFWKNDCKVPLVDHREQLAKVLFQEKLGSVLDKSERLETVAGWIASQIGADVPSCQRAAHLAKCDLSTEIVTELAKMQGIAGRYYAQLAGEPAEVAMALQEQYQPLKAGGELPKTSAGQVLAIADKTDTLVGIFGIGQRPTGTKDPFALRRSSVGLLRIIIECELELDLQTLFEASRQSFDNKLNADFNLVEVVDYALERLRSYYQEQGMRADVVDAVMAKHITCPLDFDRRVKAIAGFRESEAAASLAAANKRIQNILKKAEGEVGDKVREDILAEVAEKSLATDLSAIAKELKPHVDNGDYMEAMRSTAKLRPAVDAFFDNVMVMVDDEATRANRLALLKQVGDLCSQTADLSRLQTAES